MTKKQKKNNQYKINFIKSVILKIDFKRIDNFDHVKFSSFLKKSYPSLKIEPKVEYITTLSKEKQGIDTRGFNEYRYYDEKMENCICLSESSIFFEFKKYVSFDQKLKKEFNKIFDILRNQYSLDSIVRMGLRYTNNISVNGQNLKGYIAEFLLSNNSFIESINTKHKTLEKALSLGQISLKNEDTIINFIFGNANKHYPATIIDNDFLLDYDSFITNVDKEDVSGKLDLLHSNIIDLFEMSITDKLRNLMNK
jgi:uncharacterized protein (TIGR04255 family)